MTLPELKEPKEDRDRYIVYDLGLTPAYLLRFTDRPETDSFIARINTLRQEGIVAVPADEGMSIAGFVFNVVQYHTLSYFWMVLGVRC